MRPEYVHDADGWLYRFAFVDCGKGLDRLLPQVRQGSRSRPLLVSIPLRRRGMRKRYVGKKLRLSALHGSAPGIEHRGGPRPAELAVIPRQGAPPLEIPGDVS